MPTEKMTRVQIYKLKKQREKRRKRIKILALISVAIVALALIAIACTNAVDFKEEGYTVCSGDTLWKLYSEHGAGVKWGAWLHEMIAVNGMDTDPILMTGDRIILLTAE